MFFDWDVRIDTPAAPIASVLSTAIQYWRPELRGLDVANLQPKSDHDCAQYCVREPSFCAITNEDKMKITIKVTSPLPVYARALLNFHPTPLQNAEQAKIGRTH